ncbi:TadE/TadG family type IV pilus assembly protein (plasmid) [Photobacterium sp. DA100]|uniref:TadE/TadG family type IV pilus assembly protein n=1 Tax=Photobacterium sp. DA100 TaxID=3027472 RepID=UPI0024787346|nr:TadE/TadG family type IV pilus assembly protein [Photobacterium sp. DA100]WEM45622.1 TadE/TadG family type IV pilus assembly protein [Photobacterium sp. DA100]
MKTQSQQSGVAMVEFTILLPFFLLLLLSLVELGRAFYTYAELEKISRDSARFLSGEFKGTDGLYTLDDSNITLTKNLAVYGSINGGTEAIIPALSTSQVEVTLTGNYVKVEIKYPYQPVMSFIPGYFTGKDIDLNFTLVSSYSMRVL